MTEKLSAGAVGQSCHLETGGQRGSRSEAVGPGVQAPCAGFALSAGILRKGTEYEWLEGLSRMVGVACRGQGRVEVEGKLAEMGKEGNWPGGGRVSGWWKEWTNLHALFSPGLRCDSGAGQNESAFASLILARLFLTTPEVQSF